MAGRVLVKIDGKHQFKLVHIKKPLLCIPNLAIHLNRESNDNFAPNKESHLVPILATQVQEQLNGHLNAPNKENREEDFKDKHHSVLIDLISKELGCSSEDIQGLDQISLALQIFKFLSF